GKLREIVRLRRTRDIRERWQQCALNDRPEQHVGGKTVRMGREQLVYFRIAQAALGAAQLPPAVVAYQALTPTVVLVEDVAGILRDCDLRVVARSLQPCRLRAQQLCMCCMIAELALEDRRSVGTQR